MQDNMHTEKYTRTSPSLVHLPGVPPEQALGTIIETAYQSARAHYAHPDLTGDDIASTFTFAGRSLKERLQRKKPELKGAKAQHLHDIPVYVSVEMKGSEQYDVQVDHHFGRRLSLDELITSTREKLQPYLK